MIIFGQPHLRYVVNEYMSYYYVERSHVGLDYDMIDPPSEGQGNIICQECFGGLLKSYRRAA